MIFVMVTDAQKFTPADLLAWLEPRMPRFMLPRYVEIVDDLPRNQTSMRVLKFELRAQGVSAGSWDREA